MLPEEVNPHFLWRPNLKDEKDNFLVEMAVASQPCTIITHNVKDFLQGELLFPAIFVKTASRSDTGDFPMSQTVILTIPDQEHSQARKVAMELGCAEESLYLELIHEGLA